MNKKIPTYDPYWDDPYYDDDYGNYDWYKYAHEPISEEQTWHMQQVIREQERRFEEQEIERIRSYQTEEKRRDQELVSNSSKYYFNPNKVAEQPRKEKSMFSDAEEILREALVKAKETIAEQNEILKQLLDAPTARGYVVHTDTYKVLVAIPGSGLVEVLYPYENVHGKNLNNLVKNGCMVRMQMEPVPAIVDVIPVNLNSGNTGDLVTVTKEGKNSECEVEFQGSTRIVRFGADIKLPEVGDRILVDAECHVAIRNLGADSSKFLFQGTTGISWDQIGGLETAKDALKEAIELPFQHPELYKRYNKKTIKGVLLYGPPGCGKTLLAKAAATSLAKLHARAQANTGFIYVKGPELLNKFVGNTEAQVRSLFAQARAHQKKHGYPAVIFIDEADALLSARGSRNGLGIEGTVVPQFLAEMDGLDETGAIVLLATNRPDTLDSAVVRDGRIDRKVQVTRPTQNEAVNIFKLYLKDQPLAGISVDEMADIAAKYLYSEDLKVYEGAHDFTLANLVNGAMIAGMVDKASTLALRRDIANKTAGGINAEDMLEAALSIYEQNRHLNHHEELREFKEMNRLSQNNKTETATV